MRIHLHPQHRTVELHGRRSVAKMLRELGVVPGTAMVIRDDTLLTDDDLTDEKLRVFSETELPRIHDALHVSLGYAPSECFTDAAMKESKDE